jgi:hypothetical protein
VQGKLPSSSNTGVSVGCVVVARWGRLCFRSLRAAADARRCRWRGCTWGVDEEREDGEKRVSERAVRCRPSIGAKRCEMWV